MCTLLYLPWGRGRCAAAIGLNRDEAYARPAAPPRWWPPASGTDGGVGFVAPVDLRAGGTWFGLAETGLFVALTNGRQAGPFRGERSRGALVVAALRRGNLAAAADDLAVRDAFAYGPCHLLLAQGGHVAHVAPDGGGRFAVTLLERIAHTLTNAGLDAGDTPWRPTSEFQVPSSRFKVPRSTWEGSARSGGTPNVERGPVSRVLGPSGSGRAAALGALREALTSHAEPFARCRHGAAHGTRSSAVLLLGPDLAHSRLFFAAGRPCETPFREIGLVEMGGQDPALATAAVEQRW